MSFQEKYVETEDEVKGVEILKERDSILSSQFATSSSLKVINKSKWTIVNRFRLFLKVLSVADIAT